MGAPRSARGVDTIGSPGRQFLDTTRERLVAVPAWGWLVGLVVLSAGIRFAVSFVVATPWIFPDEVLYAELGRSFAESGQLAVEGVSNWGLSIVYPILISPAYALFGDQVDAYTAVRAINAIVMSLAAVPVYLLARRFVQPASALLAAALALAIPEMGYTANVMTENAFYPLFATVAWVLVVVLEAPTWRRELALLALLAFAYFTRRQGIALVPAVVTSILIVALISSRARAPGRRWHAFVASAGRYRVLWAAIIGGVAALLVATLALGRGLGEALGSYGNLVSSDYSPREAGRWFAYNLAELDVSTGIVAVAAGLVVVVAWLRLRENAERLAFAAVTLSLVAWVVLQASIFAATSGGVPRIEGRYIFYLAPLLFVALVVWMGSRARVPTWLAGGAVLIACIWPAVLLNPGALNWTLSTDSPGLWPLLKLTEIELIFEEASIVIVLGLVIAGLAFLALPGNLRFLLPAAVLVYLILGTAHVYQRMDYISNYFRGGSFGPNRTWIDDATPSGSSVASIWAPSASYVDWLNEFFSSRIDRAYSIGLFLDHLPRAPLMVDPNTGYLLTGDGSRVDADYLVASGDYRFDGERVASDPVSDSRVYRVQGPIRLVDQITGVYPDRVSGPAVTYSRPACEGGSVELGLVSIASILSGPQTLTARDGTGTEIARTTLERGAEAQITVPLEPMGGVCQVTVEVTPTAVPDATLANGDLRELGVKITSVDYAPS